MFVNLLPAKLLIRLLIRKRLRQWAMVWSGVFMLGALAWGVKYRSLATEQARLSSLEQQIAPLKQLQEETAACALQTETLRQKLLTMHRIQGDDLALPLFTVLGNAVAAADQKLQIQRLSLTMTVPTETQAGGAAPTGPAPLSSVSLNGVVVGDVALAKFVNALRTAAVFEQVDLKSSSSWQSSMADGRQFQVECRLAE